MNIRKSIDVGCARDIAFRIFCDEINEWWPVQQGYSFGRERTDAVVIETRVGGRFYEKMKDGTEVEIGRVTACEPPARVVFTWRAPSWNASTLVEVIFNPHGDGTRVELIHSGWEQDAAIESSRGSYEKGWDLMMGLYSARAGAA